MSYEGITQGILLPGLVSGDTALSASQFRFVQGGTTPAASLARAATAGQKGILGVLQDKPLLGDPALVCGGGVTKVEAGVAIASAGLPLMCDSVGRAITAAAGVANHIYGYSLEAASGPGSIIAMAFSYHGPVTNAS